MMTSVRYWVRHSWGQVLEFSLVARQLVETITEESPPAPAEGLTQS